MNCSQNCVARALYDNMAESPDELAFRKGDLLTVLEQNTGGLEGWWLCSLRGRQGICPGNRLRLLPGVYDTGFGMAGTMAPHLTTPSGPPRVKSASPRPQETSNGDAFQQGKRRSWHVHPNKVITPQKVGDVYLYDVPAANKALPDYDVPPMRSLDTWQGTGSYSSPPKATGESYDSPRSLHPKSSGNDLSVLKGSRIPYRQPPRTKGGRPSPESTPTPPSDLDSYDIPRPIHVQVNSEGEPTETYDLPRIHAAVLGSSNRSSGVSLLSTASSQLSPSSSASSLTASESLCLSNRSSLEHAMADAYDIPPSRQPASTTTTTSTTTISSSGFAETATADPEYDVPKAPGILAGDAYDVPRILSPPEGVYDVPPQVMRDSLPRRHSEDDKTNNLLLRLSIASDSSRDSRELAELGGKELPLELASAVDTLVKLQQEVHGSISKLLAFVSPNWRRKDNLDARVYEVKLAVVRLRTALQEFVDFAQGALVNSTKAQDPNLAHKLLKLTRPLQETNSTVQRSSAELDALGWSTAKLGGEPVVPDQLDQLVSCARTLTEDVRQVASFIQGNSTLLFKRSAAVEAPTQHGLPDGPKPETPAKKGKLHAGNENLYENDSKDWIEDYDYVNLESKETVEREHDEIKQSLPGELRKSFDNLIKESQVPISESQGLVLDPNDKQVVQFYSAQAETHVVYLTNAIDAFLLTIERNQPPKIFIAHSKFVILSAHKLVYIGDTVHRNIVSAEVRAKVLQGSNKLFDGLRSTVQATKKAALQFPSVAAVQEMVDSVVDISHLAYELKLIIAQAARC